MKHVNPIPDGMQTITPHIVCAGAAEAIAFYKKAFNAVEMARLDGQDGKLMHAMIQIGDSKIMMADEYPDWGSIGPTTLKGTPVTLHMYVEDADKAFAQAVNAGATVKMPLADMFWGDRYGIVVDPFGHNWSIAMHIRDVGMAEMQANVGKACA
ncbi:MAG TPA: VOC family protein [Methylotenera sp.]|nr:VOC family protein [Methylotenera sp.]